MSKYVSQDEIEAYEVAKQQMVEDEEKRREAINEEKEMIIQDGNDRMDEAIEASEEKMRRAIEEARMVADEEIENAKLEADSSAESAKREAKRKLKQSEDKILAMQRDFECLPLLRQVYYEAPDDVFELIVSKCSYANDVELACRGLNTLRLANKRLRRVVESCTTKLTTRQTMSGPDLLPTPVIKRCKKLSEIEIWSFNLRSLEGCPIGLKKLWICRAPYLSDLSPLSSCSLMKSLWIDNSSITNISILSSMPLLEEFHCTKGSGKPSIKDLSPISSCPRLVRLNIAGNKDLDDLSPLSACTDLEFLDITHCPLITSLVPVSALANLRELMCLGIDPRTSLLPLTSCTGLACLNCSHVVMDLEELKRRRPMLTITIRH